MNTPRYPMLRFVARHGRNLVLAIAIVLLAAGVAMLAQMPSAIPGAIAIGAAVVVFVVGRALVEMVELITDMLLPK
ncbi:hypothetical protein [Bordetella bronchiseptica]|uniref:hypothetical protein n=1 Tax=Bordetella bronchiseptica TaxID=518 RepID=UPI001F30A7E4|nr:hypothetical protein [Bordetella bronchiseptica]